MVGPVRHSDFVRKHVGGSRRERSDHRFRTSDAIHNLVDGSVAAGRQHQLTTLADRPPCQFTRFARSGRRIQLHFTARLAKDFDSTVQPAGICSTFTYNADGTLATAQATTYNAGYLRYRGEIYDVDYHFNVADLLGGDADLGSLSVSVQATHNSLDVTSVTGLDRTRLDGTVVQPSWILHPQLHYSFGPLRINYSMYYRPAEKMNRTDNVENQSIIPVAGNTIHNISFDYKVDVLRFRFGINNFTDKAPSYPYSAGYGDIIGRQYFFGVNVKY